MHSSSSVLFFIHSISKALNALLLVTLKVFIKLTISARVVEVSMSSSIFKYIMNPNVSFLVECILKSQIHNVAVSRDKFCHYYRHVKLPYNELPFNEIFYLKNYFLRIMIVIASYTYNIVFKYGEHRRGFYGDHEDRQPYIVLSEELKPKFLKNLIPNFGMPTLGCRKLGAENWIPEDA
ncbi:hypothetical protein AGLY_009223 [Aphis glycines]|uniref:Uncharacterized protein n=1 Tax=Aphis glycines TaxID=307491 RepID=A0A6G0TJ33_APHGL|nr:hypothetical protein AGLY_009223 [Aphis glycines]